MHGLALRLTHVYVGSYQHLDEWADIGSFEQIGTKDITSQSDDDEGDICEPRVTEIYVLVTANKEATTDDIETALLDTHTSQGCAHEYDCCGCRSHYASSAKCLGGPVWVVTVSSSRNY